MYILQAVHAGALKYAQFLMQLVVAAPLAYVCVCTYFSLFKLGSLGPYHMVPHSTWSWSLLLNASLLSRFAAPLAFNYLHVIRMTGNQRGGRSMAFVDLMGMEDVPLLGAGFNTWFPLVMVVYVGILTTGIFEQCFTKLFVPPKLRFDSESADDEHSAQGQALLSDEHDALREGKDLGEGSNIFGMVRLVQEDSITTAMPQPSKKHAPQQMSVELGTGFSRSYSSSQHLYPAKVDRSDEVHDSEEDTIGDDADLLFSGLGRKK